MPLPTIDEIFKKGIPLASASLPLEPSQGMQPDPVRGVGELQPHSEPPATERLADSESAFILEGPVDPGEAEAVEALPEFKLIVVVRQMPALYYDDRGRGMIWAYGWHTAKLVTYDGTHPFMGLEPDLDEPNSNTPGWPLVAYNICELTNYGSMIVDGVPVTHGDTGASQQALTASAEGHPDYRRGALAYITRDPADSSVVIALHFEIKNSLYVQCSP